LSTRDLTILKLVKIHEFNQIFNSLKFVFWHVLVASFFFAITQHHKNIEQDLYSWLFWGCREWEEWTV